MPKVEAYMDKKIAAGKNNNCTLANAGVRREWYVFKFKSNNSVNGLALKHKSTNTDVPIHRGDMTIDQRTDFINAILCLQKLPGKAPKSQFPGAVSRYDDFVAYHMTNAGSLHDTIGLFPAHKHFILAFELALRNECGYKGYHPVRSISYAWLIP